MEKKAKIIATLGPAIYSENKLKKLVELGVDAFRINFSHNTIGINRIISKIRKIEKKIGKKLSLIADLQGVKLRIGKIKNEKQRIKFNQKFTFDNNKKLGDHSRINFRKKSASNIQLLLKMVHSTSFYGEIVEKLIFH